jgi:hypothetical protein
MKTAMLDVPVEKAVKEYARWRPGRTVQDQIIARAFRVIARGGKVLDLHQSMRVAGVDSAGRPKLAICRADAATVRCFRAKNWWRVSFRADKGYKNNEIDVPTGFFNGWLSEEVDARAKVPIIPPDIRGKRDLSRYCVLFEAKWEGVTTDPILLEPIGAALYRVIATWDLTAVEQAVLRGR